MLVRRLDLGAADGWIFWDPSEAYDYCYGGTRLVAPEASDEEAVKYGLRLATHESGPKNKLINDFLASSQELEEWPNGLSKSRVGPGRCVIRPKTNAFCWETPNHEKNKLLSNLGDALNELDGRLKLTPDFGRYSSIADELYQSSKHVLGVSSRHGGGGAKSAFTVTGLMQVLDSLGLLQIEVNEISVIGSAGSMGSIIVSKLMERGISVANTSDLIVPSEEQTHSRHFILGTIGTLAPLILEGGGIIITATWGGELAASDLSIIPPGSVLLPVHNLAFPSGNLGDEIVAGLLDRGIEVFPSQLLTFGGAAGCRYEWFSRKEGNAVLHKPGVHEFIKSVAKFSTERLLEYWNKCTKAEKIRSIITGNIP
jgi:hypothetical protein